jgi:CheY-like chemotaxis protein
MTMRINDGAETERASQPDTLSDTVSRFVISFVRIIRTLQLYPPEHRYVREGFVEATENLKELLGIREKITIGFRDDAVLFDDKVLLRNNPTVASLRRYLDEKNVESVTIDREVQPFELRSLASVLARNHREVMLEGAIDERFLKGISSISLNEVTYKRSDGDETAGGNAADNPLSGIEDGSADAGTIGRMITEDPKALSAALLDILRRSIKGFESLDADLEEGFLDVIETLSLTLLEDRSTDIAGLRKNMEDLLRPLAPRIVNGKLRGFVYKEMDHDIGPVLTRFSTAGRAQMLLAEARAHGGDHSHMRHTMTILAPAPNEARAVIKAARADLAVAGLDPLMAATIIEALDMLSGKELKAKVTRGLAILADSDVGALDLVRRALEKAKFDVFPCTDGGVALETALTAKPAIMIIDPVLPGVHGLEVLARLKRLRPPIPVIVTSNHDAFKSDYAVSTYPEIAFLKKPLTLEALTGAIDQLTGAADRPDGPLGPSEVFERVPAQGPTCGILRTNIIEVGVCARGRFTDTFFRILPLDEHRTGVFVADIEAGPEDGNSPFRGLGIALERKLAKFKRPSDVLKEADRVLKKTSRDSLLLSALCLEFDERLGALTAARAGYNGPMVGTPGGAPAELHLPFGPLLGAAHVGDIGLKLRETRLPFPRGACMLLYSAGALRAVGQADSDLGAQVFSSFLGKNVGLGSAETMEALKGLLNGLGVRGPGEDLQMLIIRRRGGR